MLHALGQLKSPILNWFESHPSPPVAIISDMFLGWTHHLAVELGIRRYVFYPSGALAISVILSLWCDVPKRQKSEDENEMIKFSKIPSCPVYPWWQLSPIYRSYIEGDPVSEFVKDGFRANVASYGLVINTFSGLERVYLDYLSNELGNDRLWSIGPVLPLDDVGPVERGGPSEVLSSVVSSWLDACQDHTVVYICFGSQAVLTNKQMKELTLGLEKSGVKFILCVKGKTKGHVDDEDYGDIPPGFEDRVAERGLVIKGWAPQVLILRHKAIGAFLTHCGWNSTIEGIVAGVPMLAWPMGADQFANATLLVDELKVAIRVCEGDETVLESNDLVKFLGDFTSAKWIEKRAIAKNLSKAAVEAIGKEGSSFKNLDAFVRHVSELRFGL